MLKWRNVAHARFSFFSEDLGKRLQYAAGAIEAEIIKEEVQQNRFCHLLNHNTIFYLTCLVFTVKRIKYTKHIFPPIFSQKIIIIPSTVHVNGMSM